ncbi:serine/threonine protein kinase [Gigaspora margarita]|uniref:Serine/threonine protein kinase n=1 Tax=Gigaspora margarita TaxID=4874 RepID=A0A8H4EJ97_GIGMA|nr:serine/threonine protein kinase [Gigaspora margarita]
MFTITVSGTPIILWCLVRGSTAIFDITIGRDNHVSELKEVIKKVEEPVFDSFDPDQLKLLKLKNPINDENISDIQNLSLQDDEDENDDIVLMKDMRKIVAYWPENQAPHEDLIHVIVEAPGEEKAVIEDFSKAKNELEEKFNKFDPMYFGNIQFMICYAAAGTRLRFFAIDGSSNTNSPSRLIALSNQLDINSRRDHDSVEKRVSVNYLPFAGNLDDRINFLSNLYEHAKGHTGLVQVKESPSISRQRIYKVVLETRGHFCQVRNVDEARVMSQCVLTGLSWLHKGGYVHRDIRLLNILFIPGDVDCKYVLIDFEHANVDGLVTSERLKDWDDKTLTKHNEYTAQSDLYQFGKMLRNLNTVNSEAGKNF